VGLERGPLSLVSTIEELLARNSSGSSLENRDYGRGDPLLWPRNTLYPQIVDTNFADKRRSLGRTKATEWKVRCSYSVRTSWIEMKHTWYLNCYFMTVGPTEIVTEGITMKFWLDSATAFPRLRWWMKAYIIPLQ
jgi:hypothetical protein